MLSCANMIFRRCISLQCSNPSLWGTSWYPWAYIENGCCCFTLKLPSPTPVAHTTPRHLAQALLRRYSGATQDMIREAAKPGLDKLAVLCDLIDLRKFKMSTFREGTVLGHLCPKIGTTQCPPPFSSSFPQESHKNFHAPHSVFISLSSKPLLSQFLYVYYKNG